ncbi:hypothetical protein V494_01049 [Pseudogymnoascus sp. VKM F-4513 (FW-928)]|nr:hypothetical protein V494_01049 [Pseudogymnoascus sp. VKM F-4513 (FW-928)]
MSYEHPNTAYDRLTTPTNPPPGSASYERPTQSYDRPNLPYNPLSPPSRQQQPNAPSERFLYHESDFKLDSPPTAASLINAADPEVDTQTDAGYHSDFTSTSDTEDVTYSPPPLSPLEPALEYEAYVADYPSKYEEDTDPEDDAYAPPATSPTEPRLEYATSVSDSHFSSSEDDEDVSRGRERKRAVFPEEVKTVTQTQIHDTNGHAQSAQATNEAVEKSARDSLVALGVRGLNHPQRKTGRGGSVVKNVLFVIALFVAAVATVWVINEVHYRRGLPYIKVVRG